MSSFLQYEFSLEEGVLKWADERQKQLAAQQRAEEQRLAQAQEQADGESTDTDNSDHEHENEGWTNNPDPAPTVSRAQPPPRPVLPVISNDILTPVNVSNQNDSSNEEDGRSQKPVDFSLFETEDDPFDRFERLTLNDLTELKSVFDNSGNSCDTGSSAQKSETVYENTKISNQPPNGVVTSGSSPKLTSAGVDRGDYVELDITRKSGIPNGNVKGKIVRKQKTYKGKVIPPVPPRPSLAAKTCLPPIGSEVTNGNCKPATGKPTNPFEQDTVVDGIQAEPLVKTEVPSSTYENICVRTDQKTVNFSKTSTFSIVDDVNDSNQISNPFLSTNQQTKDSATRNSKAYVNVAPIKPYPAPRTNTASSVASHADQSQDLPLPLTISPPPRPSSKQVTEHFLEYKCFWSGIGKDVYPLM